MNADLFFLLALQQTCKGGTVNNHPCGAVWCLFTLASPTQATSHPGGLGAKENLLNTLVAGGDVSAANSPCCLLPPMWIR